MIKMTTSPVTYNLLGLTKDQLKLIRSGLHAQAKSLRGMGASVSALDYDAVLDAINAAERYLLSEQ